MASIYEECEQVSKWCDLNMFLTNIQIISYKNRNNVYQELTHGKLKGINVIFYQNKYFI